MANTEKKVREYNEGGCGGDSQGVVWKLGG